MFPQYSDELWGYLRQRVPEAVSKHTSPAEYFYKSSGPDFDYTLRVHQIMISSSWHLLRGTEFQDDITDWYTKMYDWQSYNLVRQPNGSGYVTNNGLTTRTNKLFYTTVTNPMSEFVTNSRFLASTAAEDAAALSASRSDLAATWNNWGALPTNQSASYPPGPFQDDDRVGWRPTDAQRQASINALPYVAESRFNQQFVDTRKTAQFTFLRRPTYYASLNTGTIITTLQRYGLGLMWNPTFGAALQDQSASEVSSWGTKASGTSKAYEASTINTTFALNGATFAPIAGTRRLADGSISASYALSTAGMKTITFGENAVSVAITHAGAFTETIPLLKKSGETITVAPGMISLTRSGVTFVISFAPGVVVTRNTPGVSVGDDLSVENFVLSGSGAMNYSMHFDTPQQILITGDRDPANLSDAFRIVRSGSMTQTFLNAGSTPEAQWDATAGPGATVLLDGLSGNDTFTIDLSGGNPLPPTALTFDGGSGSGNSVIVNGGSAAESLTAGAGQVSLAARSSSYSNAQILTLNLGAGVDSLSLAGAAPSGGLNLNVAAGGTVAIAAGTIFPGNTTATITGTLDLNGVNASIDKIAGAGLITKSKANAAATLTIGAAGGISSFAGSIRDGASSVGLTKSGGGMLTLGGDNTFSGMTRVSAGVLRAASLTAFSPNSAVDASGGTVDLNGLANTIAALADGSSGTFRNGTANTTATLSIGNANISSGDSNFSGALVDGGGKLSIRKLGGGTLTLAGPNLFTGALTVSGGAIVVPASLTSSAGVTVDANAALKLKPGTNAVLKTPSLAVAGTLDVADNVLILPGASVGTWNNGSYSGVTGLVRDGRAGGAWNGNGIVTSMSAAKAPNAKMTLAVAKASDVGLGGAFLRGVAVGSSDVVVMYTLAGDANLSGSIDADDYFAIDAGYSRSAHAYIAGDFDYSGQVDGDDFFIIDGNFADASAAVGQITSTPLASFAALPITPVLQLIRRRDDNDALLSPPPREFMQFSK